MSWYEFLRDPTLLNRISNVETRVVPYSEGVPMSVNDGQYNNSYVHSIMTSIVGQSPQEMKKWTKLERALFTMTRWWLAPLLRLAQVNHSLILNNWMVWTNLIDREKFQIDTKEIDVLTQQYPEQLIALRSLNSHHHQTLINKCRQLGFVLFPTTRTFIYDKSLKEFSKTRNNKADTKLLGNSDFTVIRNEQIEPEHIIQIQSLYRRLYIEKHSSYSPDYSLELFQTWADDPAFDLIAICENNQAIAFVGVWVQGGLAAVPCLGYDQDREDSLKLYRMLSSLVLNKASEENLSVNFGVGAEGFKTLRGAQGFTEYMAVYCRHSDPIRRGILHTLSAICMHFHINICE